MINKLYNTISCPCDTYSVTLENGNIGCEMDNFGKAQNIAPISINNHLISGSVPKVGDKWRCTNIVCEQGDFKWDTLHVVKVEEKVGEVTSTMFNSITSTSSCNIPRSMLREYKIQNALKNYKERFGAFSVAINNEHAGAAPTSGFNIDDVEGYVNETPVFKTKEQCFWYDYENGGMGLAKQRLVVAYSEDSLVGYMPKAIIGTEKMITKIRINGLNVLSKAGDKFETINKHKDKPRNTTIPANGGFIKIQIVGRNKPTFTLSIKDSSGCSVFEKDLKNITVNGTYTLNQPIPAITGESEIYDVQLTPSADTVYYGGGSIRSNRPISGIINMKIYQYKKPTYIFKASTTAHSNTTVGNSVVTFGSDGKPTTHVTTISRDGGSNLFFIKKPPVFSDLVSSGSIIKKAIIRQDSSNTPNPEMLVRGKGHVSGSPPRVIYQGDVTVGMSFEVRITKTKTVIDSFDLDTSKEPCDDCDEMNIFTNKFKIDTVDGIFDGMMVTGKDYSGKDFLTELISVEDRYITLASTLAIHKDTVLTFDHYENGSVEDVKENSGDQLLQLDTVTRAPNNTDVTFKKYKAFPINGTISIAGAGSSVMTITTIIDEAALGNEDITFTLNVDDIVSIKPIAQDQYINIPKTTPTTSKGTYINLLAYSFGRVVYSAVGAVVIEDPKRGVIREPITGGLAEYTPNIDFVGKDKITFVVTDINDVQSDIHTIFITIK